MNHGPRVLLLRRFDASVSLVLCIAAVGILPAAIDEHLSVRSLVYTKPGARLVSRFLVLRLFAARRNPIRDIHEYFWDPCDLWSVGLFCQNETSRLFLDVVRVPMHSGASLKFDINEFLCL